MSLKTLARTHHDTQHHLCVHYITQLYARERQCHSIPEKSNLVVSLSGEGLSVSDQAW